MELEGWNRTEFKTGLVHLLWLHFSFLLSSMCGLCTYIVIILKPTFIMMAKRLWKNWASYSQIEGISSGSVLLEQDSVTLRNCPKNSCVSLAWIKSCILFLNQTQEIVLCRPSFWIIIVARGMGLLLDQLSLPWELGMVQFT